MHQTVIDYFFFSHERVIFLFFIFSIIHSLPCK